MDAKDILIENAADRVSENDLSKFSEISTSIPNNNTKNYQDESSLPLAKVDLPISRPCAVIGPDRILPQPSKAVLHPKKTPYESWVTTENVYRHPPEYSNKIASYQSPLRNISPRQTFQENMQRIMVPPTYNSMKTDDNMNIILNRNTSLNKDNKPTGSVEPKYCDVPYSINPMNDNFKSSEMCVSDTKNGAKSDPLGWHPGSVNVRQNRTYGAHSIYETPGFGNCSNSRPVHISRPQGMLNEDCNLYAEPYYQQTNVRFRPYPNVKERYPQTRYDYLNNYTHPYTPGPPFPPPKYDIQKHIPTHPTYPQVPFKYLDSRLNESITDGYPRPSPQLNYNVPYQNQMIHPAYGPMANGLQNKLYSYTSDSSAKPMPPNKLPYNNNKFYYEYENIQNKHNSVPEGTYYINDVMRPHLKNEVIMPSYPAVNMHAIPPQYIRKENLSSKYYDYAAIAPHVRHIDPSLNTNSHIARLTSQFSPNIALSPSDSNTYNETLHAQTNYFEDCGYVGQLTNASMRNIDSNYNRMIPHNFHHRYNYQFPSMLRMPLVMSKSQLNADHNINSKDKKNIDIRQFLQMWNEGDEENTGNSKEMRKDPNKPPNQYDLKNQEQLYVLGSVNVPNEELAKYDHIEKVSKLPDNIKGCNNVELLKQFEKVVESSHFNSFNKNKIQTTNFKHHLTSSTQPRTDLTPRSVSPLDVEAKISQSVIHKDVGCNFELRLCSPDMLNVEVATPVQSLLGERIIEKVTNPYQVSEGNDLSNSGFSCNNIKIAESVNENKTESCNLINTQCSDTMKSNYTLQDLEFNSSVCLASLPRLDNDIELNFPEVNQQFINDNKESDITKIDLLSKENQSCISIDTHKVDVNLRTVQSGEQQEKVFAKLSKYRKNKKCEIESAESPSTTFSKPIRTDSVIIKNTDNSKCFEESEPLLSNNTVLENESTITNNSTITYSSTEYNKLSSNFDETLIEAAIDFSNKSSSHSIESKNIEDIESLDPLSHSQNTSTNKEHEELPNFNKIDSNTLSNELYADKNNSQDSVLQNKSQEETVQDNFCTRNNDISNDISTEDECTDATLSNMSPRTPISDDFIENPNYIFIKNEHIILRDNNDPERISTLVNNIENEKSNMSDLNRNKNNINFTDNTEHENHTSSKEPNESITNDLSNKNTLKDSTISLCEYNNTQTISPLRSNIENKTSNLSNSFKTDNNINFIDNTEDKNQISLKEPIGCITNNLKNKNTSQESYATMNFGNKTCIKEEAILDFHKSLHDSVSATYSDESSSQVGNFIENSKNNNIINEVKLIRENKYPDITKDPMEEVVHKYSEEKITNIQVSPLAISVSTVDKSLFLSNLVQTNDHEINHFKKCNLQKELFSPWIQKLIWCNEDIDFRIKSTLNRTPNRAFNNTFDAYSDFLKSPNQTQNELTNDAKYEAVSENEHIFTSNSEKSPTQTKNELTNDAKCESISGNEHIFTRDSKKSPTQTQSELTNDSYCESVSGNEHIFTGNSEKSPTQMQNELPNDAKCESVSDNENILTGNNEKSPIQMQNELTNDAKCESVSGNEHICTGNSEKSPTQTQNKLPNDTKCESVSDNENIFTGNNEKSPIQIQNELTNDAKSESVSGNGHIFTGNSEKSPIQSKNDLTNDAKYESASRNEHISTGNSEKSPNQTHNNLTNDAKYESVSRNEHISTSNSEMSPTPTQKELTNDAKFGSVSGNQHISTNNSHQINTENHNFNENCKVTSPANSFLCYPLELTTNNGNNINETESFINNEQLLIESSLQETICVDVPEIYQDNNLTIHKIICERRLKRSLSDSALCVINSELPGNLETGSIIVSKKRKIDGPLLNIHDQDHTIPDTVNNDGHINRRNSISSLYNEEQLSFCIVIDNSCILSEETDDNMSFSSNTVDTVETDIKIEPSVYSTICTEESPQLLDSEYMEPFVLEISDAKSCEKSWVDDIGCVETVVSDNDIGYVETVVSDNIDDVTTTPLSLIIDDLEDDDKNIYKSDTDHRDKVKYIYGNKMCNHDAELLETLYRTPQMNVNKTLIDKDSSEEVFDSQVATNDDDNFENKLKVIDYCKTNNSDCINNKHSYLEHKGKNINTFDQETSDISQLRDSTVYCESSIEKFISYEEKLLAPYHMPNSPEVSSTTPEEKSSAILLKITKHKGTRTSQLNNSVNISNSCKFTENSNYAKDYNCTNRRPLLTKAAQKYIPPLRESLNFKIKLPLPQHSLLRLKQLKMSKLKQCNNPKREVLVKPKPKFEDVLKSIDEIQFKMHKEKTKKQKRPVPKLVIKKNENGSHYASLPEKEYFNPDLTGRKWQPWVFIEKNDFIDKMAIKRKTKAIFNYRKNTFIFADKFQKYKSASNTKFTISQHKANNGPVGQLKCTIKLKHSY